MWSAEKSPASKEGALAVGALGGFVDAKDAVSSDVEAGGGEARVTFCRSSVFVWEVVVVWRGRISAQRNRRSKVW